MYCPIFQKKNIKTILFSYLIGYLKLIMGLNFGKIIYREELNKIIKNNNLYII